MSQQREIVLCEPVRTAIGAFNGALKGTPATDLGAAVSVKRCGVPGLRDKTWIRSPWVT
jgi:acetyl-CoA C-acetyltransferase